MITYKDAGVSIDAGNELVERIKKIVSKSKISRGAIGGFSGLFPIPSNGSKKQYISACCDGVGTKLKIAFLLNKHDTIGIDLVAMNVNDLICTGAKPLFFLDYFACGKLEVGVAEQVIRGIHNGCEQANAALLGGETAEMPGFYEKGEYDLAGFAVGLLEGGRPFNPKNIAQGDLLIGIPSSGVHSNGYSLVRKVFSNSELKTYGKELITPTKIYVKQMEPLFKEKTLVPNYVKGVAHITGGGWYDNIPRVLPEGFGVEVKKGSWEILPIFERIQKKGKISDAEMFRTFNMGIGLALIVSPHKLSKVMALLKNSVLLGEVKKGLEGVIFK